jgi:hypothetical protein
MPAYREPLTDDPRITKIAGYKQNEIYYAGHKGLICKLASIRVYAHHPILVTKAQQPQTTE